ncbi:MAG: heme biosynthesis protein HemY [Pseudorhodoplanes sp.]
MIRIVVFLALVTVIALGVSWLADQPGDVAITWAGWRIETSILVLAAAAAALVAVSILLWSAFRWLMTSPDRIALFLRRRRGQHGYHAISGGLIAIGAGDLTAARKFAGEAKRLAGDEPLALLLAAQAAQLAGDRATATRAFNAMAARNDTRLLGLRGLYVESQRRADHAAARFYAEEAMRHAPALAWAGQAVLEFRSGAGDWQGATDALEQSWRAGQLDKDLYRRRRAVLLTAHALAVMETERDEARRLALEAVKLAPHFVPAVALAGRLLAEAGELRRAARLVEKAWVADPHPDLAEAYANLRFGDSARDRLARVRTLVAKARGNPESALALARAALDAQEFSAARAALAPLLEKPTRRVALLIAELEKTEHGDEGSARQWIARALNAARDPAWTADGFVSDRWLPVSPVSGRLDAFEWKVPLEGIADQRAPVIDDESLPMKVVPPPALTVESGPKEAGPDVATKTPETGSESAAASTKLSPARREAPAEKVEAVIPLIHAPDDPGPDAAAEAEAEPEKRDESWRAARPFPP